MTDRDTVAVPGDNPVTLTPLDGLDLVAVTPRARRGPPVAVRLVDEALAGEIADLITEGSISGTDHALCHAAAHQQHPSGSGSSTRARRALDRLIARARVRSAPRR